MIDSASCMLLERLPLELREAIYTDALSHDDDIIIQPIKDSLGVSHKKESFKIPSLLSTCHQIRNEATKIFFANNHFRAIVSDASYDTLLTPIRWLSALSPRNRQNIKHLCISFTDVGVERSALHSWHDTLESLSTAGSCAVIAFAQLPQHLYQRRKQCLQGALQQLKEVPYIDHKVISFQVEESLGDMFPHIWTQCWVDCLEEMKGTFRVSKLKKVSRKRVHGRGEAGCG